MSLVKSFMTKDPITVKLDMSLEEIEAVFVKYSLTAAPLMDPWDRILGIITDFMLVKMFLRKKSTHMSGDIINFIDDLDPVVTIDENEPVHNAFKVMMQSPNHRIFALKDGKLSGALSPKDLLPFLVGASKHQKTVREEFAEAKVKIEKLLEELNQAQKKMVSYKKFFDESPFMMHSVDWDGQITMANKMLHFTLGYNDGELVGKHLTHLYSFQNIKEASASLKRIKAIGFYPPISTLMVKKNNETIKVDVATMVRRDEDDVPIGTLSISRLTETQDMMQVLREAAAIFEVEARANKLKKAKAAKSAK